MSSFCLFAVLAGYFVVFDYCAKVLLVGVVNSVDFVLLYCDLFIWLDGCIYCCFMFAGCFCLFGYLFDGCLNNCDLLLGVVNRMLVCYCLFVVV